MSVHIAVASGGARLARRSGAMTPSGCLLATAAAMGLLSLAPNAVLASGGSATPPATPVASQSGLLGDPLGGLGTATPDLVTSASESVITTVSALPSAPLAAALPIPTPTPLIPMPSVPAVLTPLPVTAATSMQLPVSASPDLTPAAGVGATSTRGGGSSTPSPAAQVVAVVRNTGPGDVLPQTAVVRPAPALAGVSLSPFAVASWPLVLRLLAIALIVAAAAGLARALRRSPT